MGERRWTWLLAGAGMVGLAAAAIADGGGARGAADQDWTPFVLVAGLLLIGLVADEEGLFEAAGAALARLAPGGCTLYAGAVVLVGAVTAVLNLDTSVAFLTPVLVHAARKRGAGGDTLLYGSLLLANAGSLFLPGSNLTNLIVAGHLRLDGAGYLARMWFPALAALAVTSLVVGVLLPPRGAKRVPDGGSPRVGPVGAVAVAAAAVLVVSLPDPAVPVVATGLVAVAVQVARRKVAAGAAIGAVGAPVLVGLFGVAVALGTAGRAWSGPETLLSHLGPWATAATAALSTVVVNNLPAASLLAARIPPHPLSLLVGLNLGPNLLATGSLAWFLWARAARSAGADPSLSRAARVGAVAVPLSIAAALGALSLTGHS